MKIIPRYIFKELLTPFSLSLAAFTFVILANKIIRLTELIVNKGVGLWTAVILFSYILPAFLVLAIPCTVLLASQIAFGRLSSESETTALFASGMSFYQLLSPVMLLSVLAFLLALTTMIFAAPHANRSFSTMLNQIGRQIVQSGSALDLKERVFLDDFTDMVIYVNKIPPAGHPLKGVLISNYRQSEEPQIISAKLGNIISHPDSLKVTIHLEEGSIHQKISAERYRKISFDSYELQLDLGKFLPGSNKEKREREMTITELRQAIKSKRSQDKPSGSLEVALHKKFALPFSCLLLGLVGAPLGMVSHRSSKSAGFVLSIGTIFIYYLLLRTGESLGAAGAISPALAMWLPNLLLLVTGVHLVRKTARQSPIKLLEWIAVLNEKLGAKLKALGKRLNLS